MIVSSARKAGFNSRFEPKEHWLMVASTWISLAGGLALLVLYFMLRAARV
jgi:hypothetical protein